MNSVAALLVLLATYAACLVLVRALRRGPMGPAAALAVAVLICGEAALLQLLSLFHAVTRPGLLLFHLAVVIAAAVVARSRRKQLPRVRAIAGHASGPGLWIAALGLLALVACLAYRPNNGDSMTYHLARVVYWLENHSVQPYPTNIVRQAVFPPGAEYLLLVLQGLSGSDHLANLAQLGAWLIVIGALPGLARLFGAGTRLSPWAGFLFAATPIALAEASSTQNDLVAAVLAIAVVFACEPFLHRRARWRPADVVLLGITCTAGLLTKPTSLLVAGPFLVWALAGAVRSGGFLPSCRRALPALPILGLLVLLTTVVLGPVWRSSAIASDETGVLRPFVYSGFSDAGDRLLNVVRGALRNVPVPWPALDGLAPPHTFGCDQPHSLCLESNLLLINDDTAANPAQLLFFLVAAGVAVARWRRLPRRSLAAVVCLAGSWVAFHMLFRDNVFVTRLQLPFFALAPLGLVAFAGLRRIPWPLRGGASLFLALTAALGALAVTVNGRRPLTPLLLNRSSEQGYYSLVQPEMQRAQEAALQAILSSGCQRLGMYVGENTYDYPLAWPAVQHGLEVRQVIGPTDWPCIVYSDRGMPPPRPSGRWEPGPVPRTYLPRD